MSKAAALQQVQKAFLAGTEPILNGPLVAQANRGVDTDDPPDEDPGKKGPPPVLKGRFSHPYYWAPFVLIGNWR